MTSSEFVTSLSSIYINPNYDVKTNLYDIAIARVKDSFPTNSFISHSCLPKDFSEDLAVPMAGEKCSTIGWGRTDVASFEISDTLQEVPVPVWNVTECPKDESLVVCGGFKEGERDTCQGEIYFSNIFNFI